MTGRSILGWHAFLLVCVLALIGPASAWWLIPLAVVILIQFTTKKGRK